MYLEYNWATCVWQARFGDTFTDIRGKRSFASLDDARAALAAAGLKLGRKTASRVYAIENVS